MSRLFYQQEARLWEQALPIGNGRLGAMVFGGADTEHLQLNEDTIWYGGPMDRINPDARENLDRVRELIFAGRIPEAEELLRYCFTGTPQSERPYQSLGDCTIRFQGNAEPAEDYVRELDLEAAVVKVSFRKGSCRYERQYFVSAPAQTAVVQMVSSEEGALSFDVLLTRERFYDSVEKAGRDTVLLKGNLGKGGSDFCLGVKVCVQGGTVKCLGEHVIVRGAARAVLYLAAGSTFRCDDPGKYVLEKLTQAAAVEFDTLIKSHIEDYQALYGRVSLKLNQDSSLSGLPTDVRLARVKEGGTDTGLAQIYFDMGRYLLISCSRPGSLPANLQGIWNDQMRPAWDSKYTININTEMNYWPAEALNLPECHEPLFGLLRRVMENGRKTAQRMYGCRGFVAHHNVDIWGDSAPQDIWIPGSYWVMGGAWLCTHLWKHYEYTLDASWLSEVYDILEEAVLFFVDFLVERYGKLLICPSVSPENTYRLPDGTQGSVCVSSTMDNSILRELLTDFLKASEVLGKSGELTRQAADILKRLPDMQAGRYGQIVEWLEDYEEVEPGHRHISQLYGLYPGTQITPEDTPELARAARCTLDRRLMHGGGHTGWSCAWLIMFYARLEEGEDAGKMLHKLLANSTSDVLLDTHPGKNGDIFQIDGNLGACAAVLQMLVQDNDRRVKLLPACPLEWSQGSLKGVKLNGAALIDMTWKDGRVTACTITALKDWSRKVIWNGQEKMVSLKTGECAALAVR